MSRRVVNITHEWQIVSSRSALFIIHREPQEAGNKILFNDVADELAAEVIPRGNKGLEVQQFIDKKTYVKSAKEIKDIEKQYQIVVED